MRVYRVIFARRRLGNCHRLGIAALVIVVVVRFGHVASALRHRRRVVVAKRGFDFIVSLYQFANGLLPFFHFWWIWAEVGSTRGSVLQRRSRVINSIIVDDSLSNCFLVQSSDLLCFGNLKLERSWIRILSEPSEQIII